jgi:uncharacterized damage-inducible protein DinB
MSIGQSLLPEFDHEMANTRKTLERVPEDKLTWKPHEKSMTMGRLAQHTGEIPSWTPVTMEKDSLDINPPGSPPYQPPSMKSRKELLEAFDKNVKSARAALAAVSDEQLMKPWSLLSGGKAYFTLPRIAVFRGFIMSHMIHHRAQLGVYLRLNNIPVPSIYGPSADEGSM